MNAIPDVPAELVQALREKKCAAFVGAGLSMGAGFPSWYKLLVELTNTGEKQGIFPASRRDEFIALLNEPSKWLMVAQELSETFGRGPFLNELARIFQRIPHAPTAAHKTLPKVPFQFVVTTNYDQLIETAYVQASGVIPTIFTNQDTPDFADALWRGEFFILKAHGDVNKRNGMILTEKDYRTVVYSAPGYRALLSAIFTTKTVFFLGASLSDPEIQLFLRSLHDAFQGSGQNHFALVSASEFTEIEVAHWRRNYNVRCIPYQASDGHPEVPAFMEAVLAALA